MTQEQARPLPLCQCKHVYERHGNPTFPDNPIKACWEFYCGCDDYQPAPLVRGPGASEEWSGEWPGPPNVPAPVPAPVGEPAAAAPEDPHAHTSGCGCACPLHPGACCECLCAVHDATPLIRDHVPPEPSVDRECSSCGSEWAICTCRGGPYENDYEALWRADALRLDRLEQAAREMLRARAAAIAAPDPIAARNARLDCDAAYAVLEQVVAAPALITDHVPPERDDEHPTPEEAAEYIWNIAPGLREQGEAGRAFWLRLAAAQIRRAIEASR